MKKTVVFIFLSLFFIEISAQEPNIILRTLKLKGDTVKLELVSGSAVKIDWGDGVAISQLVSKNIHIPSLHKNQINVNQAEIKIYGTNITFLKCCDNEIISLDVSLASTLKVLQCNSNKLNSLNTEKNLALVTLWCGKNPINELNISENISLENFSCYSTRIKALDLSKNIKLKTLISSNNSLGKLDVSNNKALVKIDCRNNGLKFLNVENNSYLVSLLIYNDGSFNANNLDACALDSLYNSLFINTGQIYVINSLYKGGVDNDINGSNIKLANERGWVVYDKNKSKELMGNGGGCISSQTL